MLSELSGRGWVVVEPPAEQDEQSVVGRYDGEPVKAGFLMEVIQEDDTVIHTKHRSGKYDLEVKVDMDIGRGQVKVSEAPGYYEN